MTIIKGLYPNHGGLMTRTDPLIFAMINCNKNYRQITQERKPVVEQHKLKNVTPPKPVHQKLVHQKLGGDFND